MSQLISTAPTSRTATDLSQLPLLPEELEVPGELSPDRFHAGELLLSPDGRYLYASYRDTSEEHEERGDAIVIYSVAEDGTLELVRHVFTRLWILRGMVLSPDADARYIIAGGQNAGGIVIYERVDGGADLKEVARNADAPGGTSFIWRPQHLAAALACRCERVVS